MGNTTTLYLRGETSFAKLLGDPLPNYSKDGFEWKVDLKIDPKDIKSLKAAGVADRVKMKENYLDGAPYLTLKVKSERTDRVTGEKYKVDPPVIVDKSGEPWDPKKLIGNGSIVDVKITIRDFGPGRPKGIYLNKTRVLKLVPYNNDDFPELDEADPFYEPASKQDTFRKDFDLDDDLPM